VRAAARVTGAELTSPAMIVAGLLLLAAGLAGGLVPTPPVTGPSWSSAVNESLDGLLWLGPLVAGAVAWQIQDYRRRGLGMLAASSPRGRAGGALPRVVAVLGWALLAYGLLLGLSVLRTDHRGTPGWPPLILALLAVVFLAAVAALGWAIGTLTTIRAAPPLLAIALFATVYAGSYGENWVGRLVPMHRDPLYRPYLQPHVALVWLQIVVLGAITALALSVPLARRGARRWTGLSAAVVLAGTLLALTKTDPDPTEIRGAPADPACAGGPVTVCLRPENADLLPGSTHALVAAAAALAPYLPVPGRFSEPGIDRRAAQGPGIFVPPPRADDPLAFQAAALAAIVPPPCPRRSGDAVATTAYGDLLVWADARVNGVAQVPPYALERFTRILAGSVPQQRAWVHHHLAAACD
jgi:hypothetical protein